MPLFEPSQHPHGMSRPRIDPMLCTALRCLETSVTSLPIGMSLRALQASLAPSILSPHLATFPSRPGTRPAPESARTQDRRMDSGGTHDSRAVLRDARRRRAAQARSTDTVATTAPQQPSCETDDPACPRRHAWRAGVHNVFSNTMCCDVCGRACASPQAVCRMMSIFRGAFKPAPRMPLHSEMFTECNGMRGTKSFGGFVQTSSHLGP